MSDKDPLASSLNKKTRLPNVNSGITKSQQGGKVVTSWKKINWTKKKLFFTSVGLGFPYTVAVVATLVSGVYLITTVLVSVGLMVLLLSQLLRWLDRDEY